MSSFEEMLSQALSQIQWPESMPQSERDTAIVQILPMLRAELSASFHAALMEDAPEMLSEDRRAISAFERRNRSRWRKPVDLLRTMIRVSEEAISERVFQRVGAPNNELNRHDRFTFDALARLSAQSLMVSREIVCLVNGGFADGALGRWRSLHETAVLSAFIATHGEVAAEKFVAASVLSSRKAMLQVNEYAARAGLDPFSDERLAAVSEECARIELSLGKGLEKEYGWAREALGLPEKSKITLFTLEESVGLDHWRPRFRWASQMIHASYVHPMASLGMCESEQCVQLTGQSNSGMVDPLQMTGVSLLISITSFLHLGGDLDSLIISDVLEMMSDRIGEIALQAESESFNRYSRGDQI